MVALTLCVRPSTFADVAAREWPAADIKPLICVGWQPTTQLRWVSCWIIAIPVHVVHAGAVDPAPAGAAQAALVGGVRLADTTRWAHRVVHIHTATTSASPTGRVGRQANQVVAESEWHILVICMFTGS